MCVMCMCVSCVFVCVMYMCVSWVMCVCHVYVCVMCVNGPGVQELKKYRIPARCRPPVRPPVCSLSLARRSFVSQSRIGQICDFLCKGFESRTRQSFQRNMSCVRAKQTSQLSRKPNSIFLCLNKDRCLSLARRPLADPSTRRWFVAR